MKTLMLLAGAAALAIASPASAKPGNGHGNGQGQGRGHDYANAFGKEHGHGHRYAYAYGDRHGRHHHGHYAYGYGAGGCPPGLAKKHNGCKPPGQAKKFYRGEHWPGYGTRYVYRRIPYEIRTRYALNPYDRYYYYDGYLYRVNPRTMLIEQVISALLR